MCSRRWALVVLLATVPPPLTAQDTALVRLRARADSLAREWRQASAIADLVDSLERERAGAGRDTIAVGALRIVTNPSPLPVREAAIRAWAVLDGLYGTAAQSLTRQPYFIRAVDPDTTEPRSVLHVGMAVPWDLDVEKLTLLLIANVPIPRPDPALGDWLSGSVRPSARPDRDLAAVYVLLVTAPSQAARSCFLGELDGCRDALDLGTSADPLERWYPSPAERRALVMRSFADYFNHGATERAFRICAERNDASCTDLLRSLPRGTLPRPLGYGAQATIVQSALRLGGRDAYRRLLADPAAPIADRLAAAAGIPLDSLLARWRAEVVASRPAPVALPTWAFVVAMGWMAVFATCGMRSSRWRVG